MPCWEFSQLKKKKNDTYSFLTTALLLAFISFQAKVDLSTRILYITEALCQCCKGRMVSNSL